MTSRGITYFLELRNVRKLLMHKVSPEWPRFACQRYLCTVVRVKPKVCMACVFVWYKKHGGSYGGSRIDDSYCCRNVEIKYFCTKNVVIHTENCELNLPLDCSTTQMEKNIRRMCGIVKSSRRRGFRNGRNVKWQGLIAINSLLESFITVWNDPVIFRNLCKSLWIFGSLLGRI